MKFTPEEAVAFVKAQSTNRPVWVGEAREYNKELEALVCGTDFIELLIRIEHREDQKQLEARRKYSHSIKDMFARVLRPIDNVYTSTGGSKIYGYNNNADYTPLIRKVSNIRDDKTLEKWLEQNVGKRLTWTDPNGVILYEFDKENFYPTYKSIKVIHSYRSNGQRMEWLLFEATNKKNADGLKIREWRFIDDTTDYSIIQQGNEFSLNTTPEATFEHPFGYVPGYIIGENVKIGSELRLSPIHDILELAKEDLRDNSHKSMFKFMLWNPIFWRYAQTCPHCSGSGNEPDGLQVCKLCNGKKLYASKDITDIVTIPLPSDKESAIVTPDIAGFIMPDKEIMEEFNKEIAILEDRIYSTIWGTINYQRIYANSRSGAKTATEIIYDTAPQITRLNEFADSAQWQEQWMTELAANFLMPTKPKDERVCVIKYGRNYIIEPVNVLLERYEDSKGKGSNTAILDKTLEEWVMAKFKADPRGLENELKRLKVEPFIHFTVEQVTDMYSAYDAKCKMLFTEWWRNEADKSKDADVLRAAFSEYCATTIKDDPAPPSGIGFQK